MSSNTLAFTVDTLRAFGDAWNRHDIETDGVDVCAFKNGKNSLKSAFRKARPNLPAAK